MTSINPNLIKFTRVTGSTTDPHGWDSLPCGDLVLVENNDPAALLNFNNLEIPLPVGTSYVPTAQMFFSTKGIRSKNYVFEGYIFSRKSSEARLGDDERNPAIPDPSSAEYWWMFRVGQYQIGTFKGMVFRVDESAEAVRRVLEEVTKGEGVAMTGEAKKVNDLLGPYSIVCSGRALQ